MFFSTFKAHLGCHVCSPVPKRAFCAERNLMAMQEVVIVGGLEMQQQAKALARRPHVVVATPGRLKVCLSYILYFLYPGLEDRSVSVVSSIFYGQCATRNSPSIYLTLLCLHSCTVTRDACSCC